MTGGFPPTSASRDPTASDPLRERPGSDETLKNELPYRILRKRERGKEQIY